VVCFTQAISGVPDKSALGWLLSNGLNLPSGESKAAKEGKATFYETVKKHLIQLSNSGESIRFEPMPYYPANIRYLNSEEHQQLSAREFTATLKQQAQITSFSGLTSGAHDEAPDYDAMADSAFQGSTQNQPQLASAIENEFPKGSTAGTALHEIFEHIDFQTPVTEQQEVLNRILEKYSFDKKYQPAAIQLIQQSVDATLTDVNQNEFSLKQLSKAQRLDEMEFYLPLELTTDTV